MPMEQIACSSSSLPSCFGNHPGLRLIDILVGPICQGHDFTHRSAEFAILVMSGYGFTGLDEVVEQTLVLRVQRTAGH